jgi:hypothetical protein
LTIFLLLSLSFSIKITNNYLTFILNLILIFFPISPKISKTVINMVTLVSSTNYYFKKSRYSCWFSLNICSDYFSPCCIIYKNSCLSFHFFISLYFLKPFSSSLDTDIRLLLFIYFWDSDIVVFFIILFSSFIYFLNIYLNLL